MKNTEERLHRFDLLDFNFYSNQQWIHLWSVMMPTLNVIIQMGQLPQVYFSGIQHFKIGKILSLNNYDL